MFKSTNGGATWSPSLVGDFVHAIAIDPRAPATLYAGTFFGMFKSTNGGASWSPSHAGLGSQSVVEVAVDPQTPAVVYAAVSDVLGGDESLLALRRRPPN